VERVVGWFGQSLLGLDDALLALVLFQLLLLLLEPSLLVRAPASGFRVQDLRCRV